MKLVDIECAGYKAMTALEGAVQPVFSALLPWVAVGAALILPAVAVALIIGAVVRSYIG